MQKTVIPIAVEAAIDPANKMTFLLDWELTMKCNLDCSYCISELYGGHLNSLKHPPLHECMDTIDFMFDYVTLYMKHKAPWSRHVVLNVYGGESLFHPNIIEILRAVREKHQKFSDQWSLTVTTTTNAVISSDRLAKLIPLIDEFTVSYHTESNEDQQQQVRDNCLAIQAAQKRIKVIVLMHYRPVHFNNALKMIDFCNEHGLKNLPRQLDHTDALVWDYSPEHVKWFESFYQTRSRSGETIKFADGVTNLSAEGRACCGGRQLALNQDFKNRHFYINNRFEGWNCSVNWFFVYIKQVTKEIFVNKDCKMNFDGTVGPIGFLTNTKDILTNLSNRLDSNTLLTIQCKKDVCWCGMCAPKAANLETYNSIMRKYKA